MHETTFVAAPSDRARDRIIVVGRRVDTSPSFMTLVSEYLQAIPDGAPSVLADLTPDELRAVLHRGTIVHAKRGDQLIAAGQTADCLFVVLEGDLDVHREGVRVGGIQQGDIAGESAYLRRRRRSADVVVGSPTATLLKLRAGSLHRAVAQHPDLDSKLQRNLSRALVLRTLADCRSTRQPASLH